MLAMIKLPTFKFIFSTLFLLALYTQVYSQTYFWSNRGKIELLTDSSRVLITTPLANACNTNGGRKTRLRTKCGERPTATNKSYNQWRVMSKYKVLSSLLRLVTVDNDDFNNLYWL
jgi:hypothetical protein